MKEDENDSSMPTAIEKLSGHFTIGVQYLYLLVSCFLTGTYSMYSVRMIMS